MKHNYKVVQRVYSSIDTNITEQFKIYVNSWMPDEIDGIENNFWANGNGLLFVWVIKSATELFGLFAIFYYVNGKFLAWRADENNATLVFQIGSMINVAKNGVKRNL